MNENKQRLGDNDAVSEKKGNTPLRIGLEVSMDFISSPNKAIGKASTCLTTWAASH